MKLYWSLGSQPGRAVKTVVDIAKIPCTLVNVDILTQQQRSPEYLKMYPAGKIPVLVHDDLVLGESAAIIGYFAELYPEKIGYLRGNTIEERAKINQYVSWYQSYFRPAMFKPIRMYLGAIFTQKPLLESHRNSLFSAMFEAISKLNSLILQNNTKYLCGDSLSMADLLFFYEMTNLVLFGLSHDKYEGIDRWFKEVYRVEEVKSIIHEWYLKGKERKQLFDTVQIVKSKGNL